MVLIVKNMTSESQEPSLGVITTKLDLLVSHIKSGKCYLNFSPSEVDLMKDIIRSMQAECNKSTQSGNGLPESTCSIYSVPSVNVDDTIDVRIMMALSKYMSPICENCARSLSSHTDMEFNYCTGCEIVFYCNNTCQSQHWTKHKMICARKDSGDQLSD